MRPRRGIALLLVLAVSSMGYPARSEALSDAAAVDPSAVLNLLQAASFEECFTTRLNAERGAPLATRADLVALARKHSARMASSGSIYHNSNLADEAPADWQSLGENVGVGPECGEIHQAFMNSPAHRKNIVDTDFNLIGVGVVVTGNGSIYVTEVFMQAGFNPAAAAPGAPGGQGGEPPAGIPSEGVAAPAPGAGITERTNAYLDQLESDDVPAPEVSKAYREDPDFGPKAKDKSFFARLKSFFNSVFSGNN